MQPDHAPCVIVGGLDFCVVVRICERMQREMPMHQRAFVVGIAFVHVLRRHRGPHREQRREDGQEDNATWRPRHSVIMSARVAARQSGTPPLSAIPLRRRAVWPTASPAAKTPP
jgi:hypothetical protein